MFYMENIITFFLSIDSLSYLQLLDIIVYQCAIFIYHYITGPSWQSGGPRYRDAIQCQKKSSECCWF